MQQGTFGPILVQVQSYIVRFQVKVDEKVQLG